ncbi:hypothetical protein LMH87_003882 [Akanthomyces muscarius]|uniref:Uncharacterized protein n=1 Tax=Akanthomyces muscarius TaxID=2231603 RepID=A0A9W8UHD5_AKAMU|nr:hypothetical protein LMH87_003882 [Akanthomyces muscarius]KAJ4145020.1 hypothetical protein LMH87_003882 [Akanthomyces muscarius]
MVSKRSPSSTRERERPHGNGLRSRLSKATELTKSGFYANTPEMEDLIRSRNPLLLGSEASCPIWKVRPVTIVLPLRSV